MITHYRQAAERFNISEATLRNWLKLGVIKSLKASDLNQFEKKLKAGLSGKLSGRASKIYSSKKNSHNELLLNKENEVSLRVLADKHRKQIKLLSLSLYLKQLAFKKLINIDEKLNVSFTKPELKNEIKCWSINLNSLNARKILNEVLKTEIDCTENILSFVYQYACAVGQKNKMGAYYTPLNVIRDIIKKTVKKPEIVFDPCCGSGNFLIESYKHFKFLKVKGAEKLIRGSDIDEMAVLIARANLTLISSAEIDSVKAVKQADFLNEYFDFKAFYILTNPPWGAVLKPENLEELRQKTGLSKTRESFSFFLKKSIDILTHEGQIGFVLPTSFLNIKAHSEIRKHILRHHRIDEIKLLKDKFSGVMTESLSLIITKDKTQESIRLIKNDSKVQFIKRSELLSGEEALFTIADDADAARALIEIENKAVRNLKNQAVWALGLVTGDNTKTLTQIKSSSAKPIIRGRDITKYRIQPCEVYLNVDIKSVQQAAPEAVYAHKPKLVYRFICNELVFAVDRKGFYTLNSANIIIPQSKNYDAEVLCAIFNSKLAAFYFKNKHNTFKVLRRHLEFFPLPEPNKRVFAEITKLVHSLEKNYDEKKADKIDSLVLSLYKLSADSLALIKQIKTSEAFVR